jgi:hypothetical protein
VLWSPKGYYDASVGGDELIGWHVNRGKDKEADFFPVSKFSATYYRPDIVSKVLDTLDEDEAIKQANADSNRKTPTAAITETLPPVVKIISPTDNTKVDGSEITIKYEIRTPADAPVTSVMLLINGAKQKIEKDVKPVKDNIYEIKTSIPERDNEVRLVAVNKNAASVPAIVTLNWKGKTKKDGVVVLKPNLYILAVGVNNYTKLKPLKFAVKDATDFVGAMRAQEGKLYKTVTAKFVIDTEATRDGILSGLAWIEKQTTSKDFAILLFSGHGGNDNNYSYYYMPVGADTDNLKVTGLPKAEIKTTLDALSGKRILFIDTCRSGGLAGKKGGSSDLTGFINELISAENGVIVFASSTGNQLSEESLKWENGAFTKAVVEGINGKAKLNNSGEITPQSLHFYIADRVKELTEGRQSPIFQKHKDVTDFPIAISPSQ